MLEHNLSAEKSRVATSEESFEEMRKAAQEISAVHSEMDALRNKCEGLQAAGEAAQRERDECVQENCALDERIRNISAAFEEQRSHLAKSIREGNEREHEECLSCV